MSDLIVRPVDDSRYSVNSQILYIMMLKNHNLALHRKEAIRFLLRNYNRQITEAFGIVFKAYFEALELFASFLRDILKK